MTGNPGNFTGASDPTPDRHREAREAPADTALRILRRMERLATPVEVKWTRDDLNRLLAALPDSGERPGLDVERLAKALMASVGTNGWLRSTPSDPAVEWMVNAEIVAAEYDRLAAPTRDAQPAPAGPEEPREGLRLHEWDFHGRTQRAVIGVRTANIAFHYREHDREAVEKVVALANAALAATPAPDTGAEERLRAALDTPIHGHDGCGNDYEPCDGSHVIVQRFRAILSGGSVDEERDSDE